MYSIGPREWRRLSLTGAIARTTGRTINASFWTRQPMAIRPEICIPWVQDVIIIAGRQAVQDEDCAVWNLKKHNPNSRGKWARDRVFGTWRVWWRYVLFYAVLIVYGRQRPKEVLAIEIIQKQLQLDIICRAVRVRTYKQQGKICGRYVAGSSEEMKLFGIILVGSTRVSQVTVRYRTDVSERSNTEFYYLLSSLPSSHSH